MARTSLDRLGSLQKAVMEAVWELGEATVQQVRDRVDRRALAGIYDDPVRHAKTGKGRLAHSSPRRTKLCLSADSHP